MGSQSSSTTAHEDRGLRSRRKQAGRRRLAIAGGALALIVAGADCLRERWQLSAASTAAAARHRPARQARRSVCVHVEPRVGLRRPRHGRRGQRPVRQEPGRRARHRGPCGRVAPADRPGARRDRNRPEPARGARVRRERRRPQRDRERGPGQRLRADSDPGRDRPVAARHAHQPRPQPPADRPDRRGRGAGPERARGAPRAPTGAASTSASIPARSSRPPFAT